MRTIKNGLNSGRCLLFLLVLGLLQFSSIESKAQKLNTSIASIGTTCNTNDGPCCYNINFTAGVNNAASLTLSFSNASCWDWSCFEAELTAAGIAWVGPAPNYTLTFTPNIPANTTITIHICPLASCGGATGTVSWTSTDALGNLSNGFWGFDDCKLGGGSWCPDCDFTDLQNPSYYDGNCYGRACYTKRSGGTASAGPFRITFSPPFRSCADQGKSTRHYLWGDDPGPHGPPCNPDGTNLIPITTWGTLGPLVSDGPGSNHMDFTPEPPNLIQACSGFCINIPLCNPATHYTIKIEDLSDPTPGHHACNPPPSMAFKTGQAPTGTLEGQTNFPNPVTEANQFKTTIPFEMAANGGDAKITFFNEAGKLVHTETSTFTGSGKHFFYFTARDVPTGTYYYTIESPLGTMIVKRSLVIVK